LSIFFKVDCTEHPDRLTFSAYSVIDDIVSFSNPVVIPTGRGNEVLEELISVEDYQEILDWHAQIAGDENGILMRPTCGPLYYRNYRIGFECAKQKKN
jgi:MoaA/NifB/PqqE/SkfB family radical SAM enzyme